MTVLLTRPIDQSLSMQKQLKVYNIDTIIEPILKIYPIKYNQKIFDTSKALIITSLNASYEIAKIDYIDKDIPIFAIGSATASPLKEKSFNQIYEASGNAESLLKVIKENYDPCFGLITYLSGKDITRDLARDLALCNYNTERIVLYKAELNSQLSIRTKRAIKNKEIDIITFMSSRTAINFIKLCRNNKLSSLLKNINAIVMSQNISDIVDKVKWKNIYISDTFTQESLIETIITNKT